MNKDKKSSETPDTAMKPLEELTQEDYSDLWQLGEMSKGIIREACEKESKKQLEKARRMEKVQDILMCVFLCLILILLGFVILTAR